MRREAAFTKQMEAMTDAYIEWDYLNKDRKGASYCVGDNGAEIPVDAGVVHATVVGLFGACSFSKMSSIEYSNINGGLAVDENVGLVMLPRDVFVASAFVCQGVVPCAPYTPSAGVTIAALELYRVAHLCCPQLSIQAWVKTISDIHGVC